MKPLKDITMFVWLTQLGLSVVLPLIGFVFLGLWLHSTFQIGKWILWLMLGLGLLSAIQGFRGSLQAMKRMTQSGSSPQPPPVSFNEHL